MHNIGKWKQKFRIIKSVKSLLKHKPFLNQIIEITSEITDFAHPTYTVADLKAILDGFENDKSPSDDNARLQSIQQLYSVIHKYFMQKAGNYDLPYDIAVDEDDFLFNKEVAEGEKQKEEEDQNKKSFSHGVSPPKRDVKRDNRKNIQSMLLTIVQEPFGEDGDDNKHFREDDSQVNIDDDDEDSFLGLEGDDDFTYLRTQVTKSGPRDWRLEAHKEHIKVFRRVHVKGWSHLVLKCIAELDHIPKHIVIKAISEINLREKWDQTFGGIEVLEHNKERDQTFFKLKLKTPYHMQTREVVLLRKQHKDFPVLHQHAIVQRTVEHARCLINPRNSIRAEMHMNGMIIEDDTSLRGTKISWILSNDLKGCLPNSMLLQMHVNYQIQFVLELVKACQQIVKGQLK